MKSTNLTFKEEKNARSNQPIILFSLVDITPGVNLDLARYDANVVFDGVTYQKSGIEFELLNENMQGEVDVVNIHVLNVSRFIQGYLETYDLRGKKILIKIVWANQLNDPDAYLEFTFYIDSYTSNDTDANFICTTKLDIMERVFPSEFFFRTHCRYRKFKDPNTCGYAGPETTCDRTPQRCKALGNYSRFGGFPSIPASHNYVV